MFERLKRAYLRRGLKDERFAFLWDTPPEDEYVAFDCETTGLNPKKDEIITIGAVLIKGDKILASKRFEATLKTKLEITKESIRIHHIRNCDIEDGMEPKEALESFLRFIGPRKLVGYYLEFVVAKISKYAKEFIRYSRTCTLVDVVSASLKKSSICTCFIWRTFNSPLIRF